MICPYCKCHESSVIYNLHVDKRMETIRRRECLYCHKRYTTLETIKSYKGMKDDKQLKPAHC